MNALNLWLKTWRALNPARRRWMPLRLWWWLKPPIRVYVHTNASLDQTGFQFYNNDGSESTATAVAAEDTNATLDVDTVYHLRIQVDDTASGAENNVNLQLQRNLNSGGWVNVDGTSSVVQSAASQLVEGNSTTARLTAPTGGSFITPNSGQDESNGLAGENNDIDFLDGTHDYVEVVYAFQILSADVADQDTIQFRVIRSGGTLDNWTVTPQATVNEGAAPISGSGAITEQADTVSGSGSVEISGTSAVTEAADTVTGAGDVPVSGTSAITENVDTVSGSGTVEDPAITGSAAITEQADTVSGSGGVEVSGTSAISEAADTVTGAGDIPISGTGAVTEAADTVAGSGSLGDDVTGTGAITEAADTVTAGGGVEVSGTAAVAEAADTIAGSGTVESGEITGTGSITELADAVAAAGGVEIAGSIIIAELADVLAGSGTSGALPRFREGYSAYGASIEPTPESLPSKEARSV